MRTNLRRGPTLTALGIAAIVLAAINAVERTPRAAQQITYDSASLYQLFQAKNVRSFEFAENGWAYHVETVTPERMYIAGVQGARTQAEAVAKFARPTAAPAADLMIVVCGKEFGDDDCDFYSPLHQVPTNGTAIRRLDGALPQYERIVKAAA